ncbi:hypothetical protein [Metabacillus fastidiosus]|uniref:hypothetical protein n=1 Tax=Metabacillus fastidiosus TaxID=1458 RepID=UPI000824C7AB|nr:hypothetical protein [Metabacillus fastidiosus]MED4464458.1 hypothetical protein [Metabacillus fastidiosus]
MQQVRLFESLFRPSVYFESLHKAEQTRGFMWRLLVLVGLSVILSILTSYLGFGTEGIMRNMDRAGSEKIETAKLFFGIGHILAGLIFPFLVIMFFTTYYWIFFELNLKELFKVQLYPMFILLIEKIANFPVFYFIGSHKESSPFGFGIIMQVLTEHPMLSVLAGQLTVFQFWAAIIQVIALKKMTENSLSKILLIVIGGHIIYIFAITIVTLLMREVNITL